MGRTSTTWQSGRSGNLAGRPKGARDRRSTLRYGLLKEVPAILKTLAKGGEGGRHPVREAHPRTHPAAAQECGGNVDPAGRRHAGEPGADGARGLRPGPHLPDEAAILMKAIAAQARVVEVEELTQRVQALEQALSGQR